MRIGSIGRALACSGIAAVAACSWNSSNTMPSFGQADITPAQPQAQARPVCAQPLDAGVMRCFAWIRTDVPAVPYVAGRAIPSGHGYTPQDIESAYKLNTTQGKGETIAIVDAYGYTQAASDLAKYRAAAGLPPCAKGCLAIVNQNGASKPLPKPNKNILADWRPEQALDLDAVSAVCPNCKILLVQTNSDNSKDLYAGVLVPAKLHANVISNSYGAPEKGNPPTQSQFDQPGIVIVAAAGDGGGGLKNHGGPQVPCVYQYVVCAGGTNLVKGGGSRGWRETVWNNLGGPLCLLGGCGATGSGCSAIVAKPSWQTDAGCKGRSAADVSASASPANGFATYVSPYGGWLESGGTSLASPLIAGIFGLAGNAASRHGAQEIWASHASLYDVTSGTNVYKGVTGPCASSVAYICIAGPGYDGPTGWGTPNGSSDF